MGQGQSGVTLRWDTGDGREEFSLKSNNPTARVGKNRRWTHKLQRNRPKWGGGGGVPEIWGTLLGSFVSKGILLFGGSIFGSPYIFVNPQNEELGATHPRARAGLGLPLLVTSTPEKEGC